MLAYFVMVPEAGTMLARHAKLSAWREHTDARSTVTDTAPELLDWPVSQTG